MVCGVWLQVIHSDVIFVALVVIIILLFSQVEGCSAYLAVSMVLRIWVLSLK